MASGFDEMGESCFGEAFCEDGDCELASCWGGAGACVGAGWSSTMEGWVSSCWGVYMTPLVAEPGARVYWSVRCWYWRL